MFDFRDHLDRKHAARLKAENEERERREKLVAAAQALFTGMLRHFGDQHAKYKMNQDGATVKITAHNGDEIKITADEGEKFDIEHFIKAAIESKGYPDLSEDEVMDWLLEWYDAI